MWFKILVVLLILAALIATGVFAFSVWLQWGNLDAEENEVEDDGDPLPEGATPIRGQKRDNYDQNVHCTYSLDNTVKELEER